MSSRYIKRIVYFLIVGVVFVIVYCVFSTTRVNAATGWTGGVQNMHMQGNKADNIQGNRQGNMQDNIQGNMQGNIQGNRQGNMKDNIQGNMQDNIQGNMQGNMQDNIQGNIQGNMQDNIQGNIQGNMQDNIQGNRQGNMKDNIQGNMQGNMKDNIQGNMQGNIQDNMQDNIQDNDVADDRRVHESVAINGNELEAVRQDDGENKAIEEGGNMVDNRKEPAQAVDDLGGNPVNIVRGHDTDNRANDDKPDIIGETNETANLDENMRFNMDHFGIRYIDNKPNDAQKKDIYPERLGEVRLPPEAIVTNEQESVIDLRLVNDRWKDFLRLRGQELNPHDGNGNKITLSNNNVNDKAFYPVNQAANQMFPSNNIQDNARNGNPFQLERNGNPFQLERPQQNQLEGIHDKGNNNVGDKAFYPVNQAANQMFPSNNIQDNARNGNPFQLERPHQNQRKGMHDKGKTLGKFKTFEEFLQEQRNKGNLFQDPGAFQQPLGHVGLGNNAQNNFIPNNEPVAPRDKMDANLLNKNADESIDGLRKLNPFAPGNVNKPQDPSHNELLHLNPFFREKLAQQHINPFVQNNPNLLGAKPLIPDGDKPLIPDGDKINFWENRLANNLQGANPIIPAGNKINDWKNPFANNLQGANRIIPAGDQINDWKNHLANRQNDPLMNGREILQNGADDAGRVTAKPNVSTADGHVQPPGERQPVLPEHGASDPKNDLEKDDTQEVSAAANPQVTCVDFRFPTGPGQLCMPAGDKAAGVSEKIQQDAANAAGVMEQIWLILSNDTSLNFIDIGATIGVHSTAAALLSRYVLAVEPLTSNHHLIRRTAVRNHVYNRIKLLERALDSEPYIGVAKPADAADSYGQVNVSRLWSEGQRSSLTDDANTVLVTTLNKLVPDVPFRRALVRLGFHGGIGDNFLEASDDFFREIIVPYIITHWPGSKPADVATKMIATLEKLGFKPHMTWDGPEVTLNPSQMDYKYLVWKRVKG